MSSDHNRVIVECIYSSHILIFPCQLDTLPCTRGYTISLFKSKSVVYRVNYHLLLSFNTLPSRVRDYLYPEECDIDEVNKYHDWIGYSWLPFDVVLLVSHSYFLLYLNFKAIIILTLMTIFFV